MKLWKQSRLHCITKSIIACNHKWLTLAKKWKSKAQPPKEAFTLSMGSWSHRPNWTRARDSALGTRATGSWPRAQARLGYTLRHEKARDREPASQIAGMEDLPSRQATCCPVGMEEEPCDTHA